MSDYEPPAEMVDAEAERHYRAADKNTFIGISLDRLKALKAAVEREERKP